MQLLGCVTLVNEEIGICEAFDLCTAFKEDRLTRHEGKSKMSSRYCGHARGDSNISSAISALVFDEWQIRAEVHEYHDVSDPVGIAGKCARSQRNSCDNAQTNFIGAHLAQMA